MTRQLVGVLALSLAMASPPVLARGGGGRSGGGRSGGGSHAMAHASGYSGGRSFSGRSAAGYGTRSATPRGGGAPGSLAERRHPNVGSGFRDRRFGGFHRPFFAGSLFFDFPFYYDAWPYYYDAPYYYGWPAYGPSDAPGYWVPNDTPGDGPADRYAPGDDEETYAGEGPHVAPADAGQLRLEVRPLDASVYVDDRFRGTARQARALTLPPGHHTIELVRPGYRTEHRDLDVVPGSNPDVLVEMQQVPQRRERL